MQAEAFERMAMAHHEAAHFVVGRYYMLGNVDRVTIRQDESRLGYVVHRLFPPPSDEDIATLLRSAPPGERESLRRYLRRGARRRWMERRVEMLLAGGVAQQIASDGAYECDDEATRGDRAQALDLLATELLHREVDDDVLDPWYSRTERSVRRPSVWLAIEALATELLRRDELPGDQAEDIVDCVLPVSSPWLDAYGRRLRRDARRRRGL